MSGLEFNLIETADNLLQLAHRLPAALLVLLAAWAVISLIKRGVDTTFKLASIEPTLRSVILSAVGFAGWIFAAAAFLNVLGMTEISLALGGTVALVAMGLASGLSGIAQDLLSGIFLIADEDFRVGHRVRAGAVEGVVRGLTARKTKIEDDDGRLHVVPNRTVDSAPYVVMPAEADDEERP